MVMNHAAEPELWDPTTSFWACPGMPENVTEHRDTEWIGRLNQVMIYPVCANLHQKIAVLATPILGLRDVGWWDTWLTCKQLR